MPQKAVILLNRDRRIKMQVLNFTATLGSFVVTPPTNYPSPPDGYWLPGDHKLSTGD